MKRHFTNAEYGALEYLSDPAGTLLVAPIALRHIGAEEYKLGTTTTAIISAGRIIAPGFCEAGIQPVALLRGKGEVNSVHASVGMLYLNIGFDLLLAAARLRALCRGPRYCIALPLLSAVCDRGSTRKCSGADTSSQRYRRLTCSACLCAASQHSSDPDIAFGNRWLRLQPHLSKCHSAERPGGMRVCEF